MITDRAVPGPPAKAAPPCVVMRAHNDMPLIRDTLAMVRRQTVSCELIVFDNDSTDGTLEAVRAVADEVHRVPRGSYIPGAVLNQGMERSHGEVVVFLNSDCTPADEGWLSRLLAAFDRDDVAAVFGRQIPRPGCRALHALDIEQTFGEQGGPWSHCFSMASSAIRRDAWEALGFSEQLQFSEDIDFTWRARQRGYQVRYAPGAVVYHSHNYDLGAAYRRQRGEGFAEARIFSWSPWRRSLLRYSALPLARKVASDWRSLLPRGEVREAAWSPVLRAVEAAGRRRGFTAAGGGAP